MSASKRCNKCGETKPHSEFSRNAASRDGLCGPCKACHARYYVANRDKRREYQASYHRDNWASNDICDARRRGPVVNLTPDYLESIQTGQCACCGHCPSDFLSLHLDRIDTALPYKPGNVAYLCGTCNVRKSDLSATDLLARFERGMAAGKDIAAHDLMLHMYIRREKRKHAPADYAQHQGVAEMSRATPR
ncbi:hypothetical protein [Burkholderia cepacia]|uniref:hypothetical protein n=1 Tax=Burkholderia cepacia TaxID=292 RepID=UPI003B563AB6